MDGEAGWWTTSGNIGLPPLARVMGVGRQQQQVSKLQKKSIRLITGSEYMAHSEPLFKEFELLKIDDLYKLKILKFYYNLSYGLLPSYFYCYLAVPNVNMPCRYELRQSARPENRLPRTTLIFTISCLLYQLNS